MRFLRYALPFALLGVMLRATASEETPFTRAAESVAALEAVSPLDRRPMFTTAVSVSLSDEKTVVIASARALGSRRPVALVKSKRSARSRWPAEVIGRDYSTDLAALETPWRPERPARISRRIAPELGQKLYCVAVDPTGRLQLAEAIVCEADVRQVGILRYERLTRVNPSAFYLPSGAAVFDADGNLFGFVVRAGLPFSPVSAGCYVNPIGAWSAELEELSETGKVTRSWIGLALLQRRSADGEKAGALVRQVMTESPAAGAGIVPGDVIVACEGVGHSREVCCVTDLTFEIARAKPGTQITLHLERRGERLTLPVVLEEMPEAYAQQMQFPHTTTVPARTLKELSISGSLSGVSTIIEGLLQKRVILEDDLDPAISISLRATAGGANALERAFLETLDMHGLDYEASDTEIRIGKGSQ